MTAVEFIAQELSKQIDNNLFMEVTFNKLFEQAKAMEKEQGKYSMGDLRNAYRWGTTVDSGTSEHFSEFVETLKTK